MTGAAFISSPERNFSTGKLLLLLESSKHMKYFIAVHSTRVAHLETCRQFGPLTRDRLDASPAELHEAEVRPHLPLRLQIPPPALV